MADSLLKAHADGRVRAAIGRGSDFYGPHALNSTVGQRVFARLLTGKPAQVLGDPDAVHTVTFIDDFARGLVTLGSRDEALGEVWHVPNAETVALRRFVQLIGEVVGRGGKVRATPSWMLGIGGLFDPDLRALREVLYQSEQPWVVDHSKFRRAFGADPTPHREGIRATVEWFRARQAAHGTSVS